MLTLFTICVLGVLFAYVGYPLSMYLLARFNPVDDTVVKDFDSSRAPSISIIIAVFGAADKIFDKLYNTFFTFYPHDKMEVIIVMDGYCKDTKKEMMRFCKEFPQHKPYIEGYSIKRGGKEAAQHCGVEHAKGDICVFTDVATTIDDNALGTLVKHFENAKIGAVDGMSKVISNGHSNEGIYLKYENKIREWESKTSGLVTLGGCLFAARKWVLQDVMHLSSTTDYEGFVEDKQSDFRTALVMQTWGFRSVLERSAIANFADGEESKEFGRKHRTLVRGFNTLLHSLHLFNPMNYGLFTYAIIGHKMFKWSVPFFMIGAYIANIFLAYNITTGFNMAWLTLLLFQTVGYLFAFQTHENKYGKILHFFVIANLAILKAWWSYVNGERFVFWEPTKR